MKNPTSTKRNANVAAMAIGAVLLSAPLAAWAGLSTGDSVGKTPDEIRTSLESLGYVVEEIEIEDDEIEAEVTMNGEELEIEIDPATGAIIEIEKEDE